MRRGRLLALATLAVFLGCQQLLELDEGSAPGIGTASTGPTGTSGATSSPSGGTSSAGGTGGTAGSTTSSSASTSSTAGTGGSSTSAGTGGTGGSSSSSSSSSSTSSSSSGGTVGLSVQYKCGDTSSTTQNIYPEFEIVNGSSSTVALSGLTVRYYITADGAASIGSQCNFAQVGCSNLTTSFGSFVGTDSDTYVEVAFSGATMIGPGGNSGPVQIQFFATGHSTTFTQTNDYSFDASKTAYADWANMTLYQNGTLVWGTEP